MDLQESKLNQYDVFVRNENYWGEKPAIKKITFNVIPDPTTRAVAFETGDIDLLYGNEGYYRSIPSPALARSGLPHPTVTADRNRDAGAQYRQSPHQRAGST